MATPASPPQDPTQSSTGTSGEAPKQSGHADLPQRPSDSADLAERPNPEDVTDHPPLPSEPPPGDDGWQPVWDGTYGRYYFYNRITGETTWQNPRVPESHDGEPPANPDPVPSAPNGADSLQYNPKIHGDYDPSAPYAQANDTAPTSEEDYTSVAAFNRFTGKFQPLNSHRVPENFNDENKSKRQMEFYFDVDAAANNHEGRSLKAERQTRRLTKKELKQFKEKRRQRKDEKRKAWLKD